MSRVADDKNRKGWQFAGRWLLILVAAIVAVLFAQAIAYNGLMRWLAEWQFLRFGRYFPVFTIVFLAGVVALAWWLIGLLYRRIRRDAPPRTVSRLAFLWGGAATFLTIAAIALAIVAIGVGIHYLRAPGEDGTLRIANVSRAQGALFTPGPARLDGLRALGPVSLYTEDLLFSTRTYYFAPVGRAASGGFNLFLEIDGPDGRIIPESATGLLRADALPSELAQLYRVNRMPVAPESAVLFKSERSANRPIIVLLIEVAAFALVAALFAFLSRRRARRLDREDEPG